jgi:hypothetical protein
MTDIDVTRMYRGDSQTITINLFLGEDPWPVPDGATVKATARSAHNGPIIWEKESPAGISVVGSAISIILAPADTEGLAMIAATRTLQCDVEVTTVGGDRFTVKRFALVVDADITQPVVV